MPTPSVLRSSTFDASAQNPVNSVNSFNATGASLLLVYFWGYSNESPANLAASFNGVAMTRLGTWPTTAVMSGAVFALVAPAQTTANVVVNSPGLTYVTNQGSVTVIAIQNSAASSPIEAFDLDSVTTTPLTSSVTTAGGEILLLAGAGSYGGSGPSITGTGATFSNFITDPTVTSFFKEAFATASVTAAGTYSSATNVTGGTLPAQQGLVAIKGTASATNQTVNLSGISNTNSVGQPSIVPSLSITMGGIASGSAVGEPSVAASLALTVEGIAPTAVVGDPTIIAPGTIQTLSIEGIPSGSVVGLPTVIGPPQEITLEGIPETSVMGEPEVRSIYTVSPLGLESTLEVGEPSLDLSLSLTMGSIQSTAQLGFPTIPIPPTILSIAGMVSTSRVGRPKLAVPTIFPIVLQPGESRTLVGVFTPSQTGLRTGTLSISYDDVLSKSVPLSGIGLSNIVVTISDGVLTDDVTTITMTISDGVITEGTVTSENVVLQMAGIPSNSQVGRPTIEAAAEGALTYLSADGALMRDASGEGVLLRSCNYYGLEQAGVPYGTWAAPYKTITVGGVTQEGMLDKIKRLGFNSIRLLVSVDMTKTDSEGKFFTARTAPETPAWNSTFINADLNPDLVKSRDVMTGYIVPHDVITILDKLVDHCEAIGLRIIFDMHCLAADNSNINTTQGKWYTTATRFGAESGDRWTRWIDGARRNETSYIEAWKFYANRYKNRPVVCAFDLLNEPYNSTWSRNLDHGLVALYERVGKEIHAINPDVMLICEGSCTPPEDAWNFDETFTEGEKTWGSIWSGYLQKVRDPALRIGSAEPGIKPNKVAYSPHEYGHEAGPPNWFTKSLKGKSFPSNLFEVWRQQWGYLAEENIAPVWIGEFGSTWRVGDAGFTTEAKAMDQEWLHRLADYCHSRRIGTAFWGFVPDVIGGLVETDYVTERTDKLTGFLNRFFDPAPTPVEALPAPITGSGSSSPQSITVAGIASTSQVGQPSVSVPSLIPDRPVVVYFETWADPSVADGADSLMVTAMPSNVDVVNVSFAKPNLTYTAGSYNISDTGLNWSFGGLNLKQAVTALHARYPNIKVLLSVGGSSFATSTNWNSLNPTAIANLVADIGFDGVDLDIELPGVCTVTGGTISCTEDARYVSAVDSIRAVLPRPKILTMAAFGVGAYRVGQFTASQPEWSLGGDMVNFLGSASASKVDLIFVMGYDSTDVYNPQEAFTAYRALWSGPLVLGMAVHGGSEAPTSVFEIAANKAFLAADPKAGLGIWSFLGTPNTSSIPAGPLNPTPLQMLTAIGELSSTVETFTPARVLNIGVDAAQNHFELQMARTGDSGPKIYTMGNLMAGYTEDPYFKVTDVAGVKRVQMRVALDAPVLGSTTFARCELREVDKFGTNIAYNALVGTHEMSGKTKITHLPAADPEIIIAQLFNGDADRVCIRTQLISGVTKVLIRVNGTSTGLARIYEDYVMGTEFSWKIRVSGGVVTVFGNDMTTPLVTSSGLVATAGVNTWYFKAGAYAQATPASGGAGEYVAAELRDLVVSHS